MWQTGIDNSTDGSTNPASCETSSIFWCRERITSEHAQTLVQLDETHAAHVRGEVINPVAALHCRFAGVLFLEVELHILHVVEPLVPLIERLYVRGADGLHALPSQVGHELAANETAGAANLDFVRKGHKDRV